MNQDHKALIDETGNIHGRWTVIKRAPNNKWGSTRWFCKCICGTERAVSARDLRAGASLSCRCFMREKNSKSQTNDRVGQRFGKLLVIERVGTKNESATWKCKCDCGNFVIVRATSLRTGNTTTCGCSTRLPSGEAAFNFIFSAMKRGATARGYSWEISKEIAKSLMTKNCYYCGKPPLQNPFRDKKGFNGYFLYNGLDRVNNSLGYSKDNIVSCCGDCNKAKGISSQKDFFTLIKSIYEHLHLGKEITRDLTTSVS